MFGRVAIMAGALFLLLAWAAPAAIADQGVLRDQQYQMAGKNIIVHLIGINVVDVPQSNVMPQPGMKYYQIIYNFTNIGTTEDKAFIQPIFVDASGGEYRYIDYTSINVLPGRTTDNTFIEMPVQKNTVITKVIFVEGFDSHTFDLQQPAASSSPVPSSGPVTSATPAPEGNNWAGCLPLIPFAMAGGVAGVGIVINRCGLKKK